VPGYGGCKNKSLSAEEAENYAASAIAIADLFLSNLLEYLGLKQHKTSQVYEPASQAPKRAQSDWERTTEKDTTRS
jgi:hypothetical protein